MNSLIESMTEKDSLTLNGAVTNSTTHNYNVDLFFLAGACRNESEENIKLALAKSYGFNRENTLKIIFWAGDIRQGAGERRFFKLAMNWLYLVYREDFYKYFDKVAEFSRWDVLFDFADDKKVMEYIVKNFKEGNALLCKWLPRKAKTKDKWTVEKREGNTTVKTIKTKTRTVKNGFALKLRKALGWNEKQYRQHLVKYTKVVEQNMCAKDWSSIEYSKVPSVALNKYNKAWYRNDEERFTQYIEDVKSGKSKINASVIFPHDIIKSVIDIGGWNVRINALNDAQVTQWNNLPNYLSGINSILPVVDTSGSMFGYGGLPAYIALSLGLYISERNEGCFKDAFITFSETPVMQYLKGDLNQRLQELAHAEWGSNTNLLGVFDTILTKAVENKISEEEMPRMILIISDMEFDSCARLTNYESIKMRYMSAGYQLPKIVFWNVNGRAKNLPVTVNDIGVALVSGASPSIIKSVLSGDIDPVKVMENTILKERYAFLK